MPLCARFEARTGHPTATLSRARFSAARFFLLRAIVTLLACLMPRRRVCRLRDGAVSVRS